MDAGGTTTELHAIAEWSMIVHQLEHGIRDLAG